MTIKRPTVGETPPKPGPTWEATLTAKTSNCTETIHANIDKRVWSTLKGILSDNTAQELDDQEEASASVRQSFVAKIKVLEDDLARQKKEAADSEEKYLRQLLKRLEILKKVARLEIELKEEKSKNMENKTALQNLQNNKENTDSIAENIGDERFEEKIIVKSESEASSPGTEAKPDQSLKPTLRVTGNYMWPVSKRELIANTTTAYLNGLNAQKTITPQTILGLLETQPSYIDLCVQLQDMSLKFNCREFAQALLASVPNVGADSMSTASTAV